MQPKPMADTSRPLLSQCSLLHRSHSPVCYPQPILFVADLLHPLDGLAVQRFLDGDVTHAGRGGRAVPVLLAGRNQITSPGLISSTGPPSRCTQPKPGGDDQRLPERMGVPGGARARLESDAGRPATRAGSGASNSGSTRTAPVKYSAGPLPDGREPFRLISIASPILYEHRCDRIVASRASTRRSMANLVGAPPCD